MTSVATSPRSVIRVPVFVALGVILWFLAAMMFRFVGPAVLVPGSASLALVFALPVPIAWVFLWLGTTAVGVRGPAVLSAAVVLCFTAMLLDALALTFFPALYNLSTAQLLIVAALLLWAVAWILLIAFVQGRRAE